MKDVGPALLRIDDALVRGGVPPLSPRWREELLAFYASGTKLHAARVGRGGAKSTASVKAQIAELLAGDWRVPPGERHWGMFVSENLDEAKARIGQLEQYLRILGVPFTRSGEQLLLSDLPLGFWVRACRIGAVSGPRVVSYSIDESAKLDVEGVNPAEEILTSLRAASVTHPGARGRLYSSPWATLDHHYDVIERGTTKDTFVSIGPTWEFNPAIAESQTRELEPDEKKWQREYAAIPMSAASQAFDDEAIQRCFAPRPADVKAQRVLVLDPSSGRKDAWTWGVAGWSRDTNGAFLSFDSIDAITGEFWKQVSGGEIVAKLVALAKTLGIFRVFADQREALMLSSAFREAGLTYTSIAWTSPNKIEAVEAIRRHMRARTLAITEHEEMRRELRAFEERATTSGSFTFAGRRAGDDHVALLITLMLADATGGLEKAYEPSAAPAPVYRSRERTVSSFGCGSRRSW